MRSPMVSPKSFFILALVACVLCGLRIRVAGATTPDPALVEVDNVPGLPRILLIGDSISMGYTIPVRNKLKGIANVHRPPTNCESTRKGLKELGQWIGTNRWDLIHFNWGLHDLKYVDSNGNMTDVQKGRQNVGLKEYRTNLEELVKQLEKTGAILVWRNTTPVPEGAKGRIPGDELEYNQAASGIMSRHKILVEDLHSLAKTRSVEIQQKANVHFTQQGYEALAQHVTNVIVPLLGARQARTGAK